MQSSDNVFQGQQPDPNHAPDPRMTIPVVEEQLQIGKDVVETGRIRVSKTVHEEERVIDVPIIQEEVNVERVAINQYVATPPAVRYEGDTMVMPILREVLVVEKRLLLVEEVRITKLQTETRTPQQVTLRKEEIHLERVAPNTAPSTDPSIQA
ncbi:YsnF/AvaK domain-containing protein [Hymenobacter sp. HDW8]|uniref:YsnF/AvaK domain-containing protein n=1 Tax=Hymenobacter sp. HDW8 TaxID=2714932 RepID=UPI00196B4A3E|nr:YsnF/AvaK domain-containing protein [Hymenobacter sp. HDW8]